MGIQGLTKLIQDHAPGALKEQKFENYFGRKIAVDASMHIYSFLVVVGRTGDQLLTSETGEITSHILGMFFRTTRMLEAGIKPVFVFEGKPPSLKKEELAKRSAKREGANVELQTAIESGDKEAIEKFAKRTIRVTPQHNDDCKKLLKLMGIPVIDAPSEAEAQCAQLCKEGLVYGISTEDMDSLTLGTPRLLRHLMAPAAQKVSVLEFDHEKILQELNLTNDEFIDLCILCGCDYTEKIPGIGPIRALNLVQKYKSIEKILENLDPEKHKLPDPFPYEAARKLFKEPDVLKGSNDAIMKWRAPDEKGLIDFLVKEKNFDEKRVKSALARIAASKHKSSQGRLESFFGPSITIKSTSAKRKADESKKGKGNAKKTKGKLGKIGKSK